MKSYIYSSPARQGQAKQRNQPELINKDMNNWAGFLCQKTLELGEFVIDSTNVADNVGSIVTLMNGENSARKIMTQDQTLSKSAQGVQAALDGKGITCQVIELSDSTRTAVDAANAIGCDVAQICKSLIFKTKDTSKPVLVLASGPNRVNEKTIENHVGEKIAKADADFVREVTGFAIGGIPPIGHKQNIELTFIDEDLLKFEELWAAAGTPNAVFNLKGKDLLAMTHGTIISIV